MQLLKYQLRETSGLKKAAGQFISTHVKSNQIVNFSSSQRVQKKYPAVTFSQKPKLS